MANTLSAAARTELSLSGIRPRDWIAAHGNPPARGWTGDSCGCPDDRCTGFHHGADEQCMCLQALIRSYLNG